MVQIKAGDPLHPVTVVMPSALASVTVRRSLASDGLVATELVSLPALVPRLASRVLASRGRVLRDEMFGEPELEIGGLQNSRPCGLSAGSPE